MKASTARRPSDGRSVSRGKRLRATSVSSSLPSTSRAISDGSRASMIAPSTPHDTGEAHRGRGHGPNKQRTALLRLNGGNKWQTFVGHCYQRAAVSPSSKLSQGELQNQTTPRRRSLSARDRAVSPRRCRNYLVCADLLITHFITRKISPDSRARPSRSRDSSRTAGCATKGKREANGGVGSSEERHHVF